MTKLTCATVLLLAATRPAWGLISIRDQSASYVFNPLFRTYAVRWIPNPQRNHDGFFLAGDYLRDGLQTREHGVWTTDPSFLSSSAYYDSNPQVDPQVDTLRLVGGTIGVVHVEREYVIRGSPQGVGRCELVERVLLANTSAQPTIAHYFHTNFIPFSTGGLSDAVVAIDPSTVVVTDGLWRLTETVSGILPSITRVGGQGDRFGLEDESISTLVPSAGPVLGEPSQWCFQWDIPLAPGQAMTFDIRSTYEAVPAPGTLLTLLLAPALTRRRRAAVR